MRSAVRPYVAAAVAIVGSTAIAASPVAPEPEAPAAPALQLTGSFKNIPVNLFQDIASIPANMILGLQQLTDGLDYTGPWAVYSPTNVLGTDRADPPKYKGAVNFLVPFPALSVPLGEMVATIAAAEVPMYSGCPWLGRLCVDLPGLLADNLQVSIFELLAGYTFPVVVNPADGQEEPWSGQTVKIEPLAPFKAYFDSLLEEPDGIETVSFGEIVTSTVEFAVAMWDAFNIFVQGSYLYDPNVNPLAFLIPPTIGRILCNCDDPNEKPYPTDFPPDEQQVAAANAVISSPDSDLQGPDDAEVAGRGAVPVVENHAAVAADEPGDVLAASSVAESDSPAGDEAPGDPVSTEKGPASPQAASEAESAGSEASPDEDSVSGSTPSSLDPLVVVDGEPTASEDSDELPEAGTGSAVRTGSKPFGRLSEALASVSDRISSRLSKITDDAGKRVARSAVGTGRSATLTGAGNKAEPRRAGASSGSSDGALRGAAKAAGAGAGAGVSDPTDRSTGGTGPGVADGGRNLE